MENIHQIDQEQSIDTDKLSYEIFSILESKFLFGYDDQQHKVWINPKQLTSSTTSPSSTTPQHVANSPSRLLGLGGNNDFKNQRGKICILSIDGGGMRSIVSGKALEYLENALKLKSGNCDAKIADYFDVGVGSGVGGIFTAMLFASKDHEKPMFCADETWKLLAEKGRKFYGSGRKSGGSGKNGGFFKKVFNVGGGGGGGVGGATVRLEKVLKEAFIDLTLKDTLKPVLIPCYDLSSGAPFLFSRADALEADSFDFRLWEVCRATSAEPAVFEPVMMRSVDGSTDCMAVDGGLAMSNPAAAAITHVLHNKQEFPFVRGVEDILVLSLGTGQLPEGSFEYEKVRKWKAKDWARPMARIYSDGSADFVDHAIAMAFGQARSNNYVRIQADSSSFAQCGGEVDYDPSLKNVKALIGVADDMLKQRYVESVLFTGKKLGEQCNFEKLDWFAGQLVEEHQRRSCRIAPTVAFKQATPRTPNVNDRI
ncbi:hypothetical protein Leryth_012458 [Lithospermum erythrorhizon]|nr:hypothetical protein Leryth_012458 [Lithospermum erythrorhizon]